MKPMSCFFILFFSLVINANAQQGIKIAKLKYDGGGDWYANKTALPNLISFCNKNLDMGLAEQEDVVDVGSPELFLYPYVYMTGHGNVVFSPEQAANLRKYLIGGGFLHVDDNYGLDPYIRPELKKVFPELDLVELPFTHEIYHEKYNLDQGLPKVHEHDGKRAQGLALIYKGRVVVFYSYDCDLGNGWEDQVIYNDPDSLRQLALKAGANLLTYAFTHE